MITVRDSVEIKVTPDKVFAWLTNIKNKETYQAWHPGHVELIWVKGEPWEEGSIMYCEEYLHGVLHKLKFKCTKKVKDKLIEYRPLFPLSLFAPGNAFIFEPKGENSCVFTATGRIRGGPLFKKLGKKKLDATMQHVKEEGENIKRILEEDKS